MAAPTPPGLLRAAAPNMRAIIFEVPKPAISRPNIAPVYVLPMRANPKPTATRVPEIRSRLVGPTFMFK